MIFSKVSNGVTVSVTTRYEGDYSNPLQGEYMHSYTVCLENDNPFPVRLLTRHWHIFDADGSYREVEGEGVIGKQPRIDSGALHQYTFGVHLHTEAGRMHGSYTMENMLTRARFRVEVPAFELIYPPKLN